MIEIRDLTKSYDDICAVNHVTFTIPEGVMYGLLGTNGAGKTSLLRMLAGIVEPDSGEILFDGEIAGENPAYKENVFYLSDTPYYFPNASMEEMARFYARQYPNEDIEGVHHLAEQLELDVRRPIRTFSKGMKRQAFLILALCANTKYILCDEVFDGLDPLVTETMKDRLKQEMEARNLTVVVASHKLQELEDICHHIGILHKGGLLGAGEMKEQMTEVRKYQCVFSEEQSWETQEQYLREHLNIVRCKKDGYFITLTVRGEAETAIRKMHPVFCHEVPMSLEEIFLAEMEVESYDA